jgi:hypothetical protein
MPNYAASDPLGTTFKKKKIEARDNRFNYPPSYSSAVTIG